MNIQLTHILESVLIESGGTPGVNSLLDKRFFKSTIDNTNKILGLSSIKMKPLGNTSKPILGDVDLAVSMKDIASVIGTTNPKTFWKDLDSYLKKKKVKDYVISKGLSQFSVSVPMVDSSKKQKNRISDRSGTLDPTTLAWVQVDYMIGDVDWMGDILTSNPDSNYKGAHRNIFIMSILSNIFLNTKGSSAIKKKTQLNLRKGFQIVDLGKTKRGRITKSNIKTITKDLSKVAVFLFGSGTNKNDINSFESIWKLFNSTKFKFPEQRSNIITDFKNRISKTRGLDVPSEV